MSDLKTLSPFVMMLALFWFGTCRSQDQCSPTTLATNSYVVSGKVVLKDRANQIFGVEVEVFWFRAGAWESIGKIYPLSRGGFAWLAENSGQYKFAASKKGFRTNVVILKVSNRKEAHRDIVLPLSKDACPRARFK